MDSPFHPIYTQNMFNRSLPHSESKSGTWSTCWLHPITGIFTYEPFFHTQPLSRLSISPDERTIMFGTLRETSMSLDNLPGLPKPSTLSSQSSRPSWTGDLPQCLRRWLPQVFLPQSTIPVPPCELESPCQSWVNTRTSFPLPKGTLDFWLSWRPGTVSAQEQGKTAQKLSLWHKGPPMSWSWAKARTYATVRPSTICRSLANARTLPHDPPPTKWIEWTHYGDCPQSACNMPTLSARGPISTQCQRIANVYPKEPEGGRCYADFPKSDCNTLLVYGDSFC